MELFKHKNERTLPSPLSSSPLPLKYITLHPIGTFLKVNTSAQDFYDEKIYLKDKNHDLTLLDYAGFSWFVGKVVGYTHPSHFHINGPHCFIDGAPSLSYILNIFPNVFTINVYDSGFLEKFEKSSQEEYEKQLEVIRPIAELRMKERLFPNETEKEIVDLYFDSTIKIFEKLEKCINDPLESASYISKIENRFLQMEERFEKYEKPIGKLKKDFIELIMNAKL